MKTFEFKGTFKKGSVLNYPFKKTIEANSKEEALNKLYIILGSNYKCPRRFIKIENG